MKTHHTQYRTGDMPEPIPAQWLYIGIGLFVLLLVITVVLLKKDWVDQIEAGRARVTYELIHGTVPSRPTDTPGVVAWLNWELEQYLSTQVPGFPSELIDWQDPPPPFAPLARELETTVANPEVVQFERDDFGEPAQDLQLRTRFFLRYQHDHFVVTRRKSVGGDQVSDPNTPANRFLYQAIPHMSRVAGKLDDLLPGEVQSTRPRIVRMFGLCEDGTLITMPYPGAVEAEREAIIRREGRELAKMPKLPNLVSNEFFFTFNYNEPPRSFYSGFYLDLAGNGLIASLSAPLQSADNHLKGLVGADIAFQLDWQDFVGFIDQRFPAALVPSQPLSADHGPWRPLLRGIDHKARPRLYQAVQRLAQTEKGKGRYQTPVSIYHGLAEGGGALVGFPVTRDQWLVVLFPESQPEFPWLSFALLGILFLLLLAGFEWNRRGAEAARGKAVREFAEKQNLLNSMQVPLMVVDPNTEQVVYGNRAALDLGIRVGKSMRSLVCEDPGVIQFYERMQVADTKVRRAYGLPLKIEGATRYGIIRSVAVTAPIEMIHADERHRLGILFLLEEEQDLGLYHRAVEQATRSDERHKLAGLLNHGLDTLTRVLHRALLREADEEMVIWLSSYLQRRLQAVAWVLDHWEAAAPLQVENVIEAVNAATTLSHLRQIFRFVGSDPNLRAQLHWNNGTLATADNHVAEVLAVDMDWPDSHCVTCPVRGGFGLFLTEVLINAVRHGSPGSVPICRIELDPIRSQLNFTVENQIAPNTRPGPVRPYGGRALLEKLADLFGWQDLRFEVDKTFRVTWFIEAVEKPEPASGD